MTPAPRLRIDHDVPFPVGGRGRRRKYPFYDMAVADSVFIPDATRATINGSIACCQRKTGWHFTLRSETNGVRVWRTR